MENERASRDTMRMLILALDTSTEACSVALMCANGVLERYTVAGRSHTEQLIPMVQGLLAEAGVGAGQLDALVCGIGPGSFAGVRIGVGFAKGLALARDLPAVGVSSLAMLAQQAMDEGADSVLPCIDARMNEVYFGAYRRGDDGLAVGAQDEAVCPASLVTLPPGSWDTAVAVGSGWGVARDDLIGAIGRAPNHIQAAALPHAAVGLKLALPRLQKGEGMSADRLVPAYLRDRVALTLKEQAIARQSVRR